MALDVKRVRALCFDLDGTLSDTDDHYAARLAGILRRLRLSARPERLARRLVMWSETPANLLMEVADRLSIDDEIIGVASWVSRRARMPARSIPPIPGVAAMLAELHRDYPLAVVSARDEAGTLTFLEMAGIRPHFDAVITAFSTARAKPFPDPVLLAARTLATEPGACLMIGDTTVDMRAGRAAGAQTVGVLCGFGERDELLRHGADLILPTTAHLAQALASA